MIEEDTGGGEGGGINAGNKNTDLADDYDDDEHEPCSKKVMPALFAWFLLISTSSSYFTLVLPEFINLIGLDQIHLFISIVGAHAFIFIYVVLNFSIATFMDPGRFPKVDLKDTLEEEGIHHSGTYKNVLINDINVRMKWCTTCQFYRPPRSSHCGVCNACIDTMDHHCPWVCNCIARRNYKYFLQFLISLSIHMLAIFGLCLTLVLFNKDNLTHIPIIIAILLIVIVGILIIPIGGLTGFHIVLVSRGRTTNEQVTGKFRTGVNPFDNGCWNNWKQVLCISTAPSYIQFKRKRQKQREYLEAKLTLLKYQQHSAKSPIAASKYIQQHENPIKKIYNDPTIISKNHDIPILIESSTKQLPLQASKFESVDVQNELKSKRKHQLHQMHSNNSNSTNTNQNSNYKKSTSSCHNNSKVAYQHGQRVNEAETAVFDPNLENQYDNNLFTFQNYPNANTACSNGNGNGNGLNGVLNHKQIKQQQHLLEINQKQLQQKQHKNQPAVNSNVWIDRKSNKLILNKNSQEDEHFSNSFQQKMNKKLRKHEQISNKNAIDKLMLSERKLLLQQHQQQQFLVNENSGRDGGGSSSVDSSSSRCIRNNSYLNANHNNNLKSNLLAGVNNSNSMSSSLDRPPSSASNTSSMNQNDASVYSNLIKTHSHGSKKKRKTAGSATSIGNGSSAGGSVNSKVNGNHNHNLYQLNEVDKFPLEIIDELKSGKGSQDYASYEITV